MPYNITQKILLHHSGKKEIQPGDFAEIKVDFSLANDITAPIAIKNFIELKTKLHSPDKIAIVLDHFVPNKDIQSAEQCRYIREFVREWKIKNFFECTGIEHALLPENGLVLPGDVVIGADSHTCTYGAIGSFSTGVGSTDLLSIWVTGKVWLKIPEFMKVILTGKLNRYVTGKDIILYLINKLGVDGGNNKSLEFDGEVTGDLTMADRFTICNMVIECGAENGIIQPDEKTIAYIKPHAKRKYKIFKSDKDAVYQEIIEIDCSKIQPLVALPHLPSNIKPVSEINRIYIDQVFIGSCTNGWYEDMIRAAEILAGKKVNKNVRLLISPATMDIYKKMLKTGILNLFLESGAIVIPPSCGPCLGGHLGILGKGEKCLSTTNRNFKGRMGHMDSEVYLSNPYIAAASAISGYITHPSDVTVFKK